MIEQRVRTVSLGDGLILEFHDKSNRYFGDYYRVLVEVDALIDVDGEQLRMRYQRPLRRMGVPTDSVTDQLDLLINEFLETTSAYMVQPGYVGKLIEQSKKVGKQIWRRV